MLDILSDIAQITVNIIAGKALIVGSDFSFYNWFKYGKKYWNWYKNRPKFKT